MSQFIFSPPGGIPPWGLGQPPGPPFGSETLLLSAFHFGPGGATPPGGDSPWQGHRLFATLAHFEGALDSPSAPSVKDRVLDWHMRYNIFCSNLLYIKDQLWCFRPTVDAQAVHECADLVSGLHLLPTQGRRGVLSTGKSGWSPAIGWGGTDAFFILSGCATRPQSNCRHTARVRVCHTAQACEPATFAPLSGAPLLV